MKKLGLILSVAAIVFTFLAVREVNASGNWGSYMPYNSYDYGMVSPYNVPRNNLYSDSSYYYDNYASYTPYNSNYNFYNRKKNFRYYNNYDNRAYYQSYNSW